MPIARWGPPRPRQQVAGRLQAPALQELPCAGPAAAVQAGCTATQAVRMLCPHAVWGSWAATQACAALRNTQSSWQAQMHVPCEAETRPQRLKATVQGWAAAQAVAKLQTQRLEHMPYQDGDTDWRQASAGFARLEPCQHEAAAALGWASLDLTADGLDLVQLIRGCQCAPGLGGAAPLLAASMCAVPAVEAAQAAQQVPGCVPPGESGAQRTRAPSASGLPTAWAAWHFLQRCVPPTAPVAHPPQLSVTACAATRAGPATQGARAAGAMTRACRAWTTCWAAPVRATRAGSASCPRAWAATAAAGTTPCAGGDHACCPACRLSTAGRAH